MNEVGVVLLMLAVGSLVAAFAVLSYLAQKKRREDVAQLASRLGWDFDPSRDASHDDRYAHFEIFRRGHSRAAYNTLRGAIDVAGISLDATAGDFTYKVTRSNGKTTTTQTYRFSYLIVHLPLAAVPDLLIRREGLFDRLAGAIGFDDIDFESAEFSRAYFVKSKDKRFAYDVVHPRMMEFLMQASPPAIDIEQGRCCLSNGRSVWTPAEFEWTMGVAARFFSLWPEHSEYRLGLTPGGAART